MIDAQLPGQWQGSEVSFVAANGTQAKILCDVAPPMVVPAIAGEVQLPGESTVRQRIRTGGQRIIDGAIASTAAVNSILMYLGTLLSLYAGLGVPTITGTNTLNRTAGSFITDGWKVGDSLMGFGHLTPANDGVMAICTAVAAGALTFNGAPFTNENVPAGYRAFRVALKTRRGVPLNAGNTDAIPPVQLLGGTQDPSAFLPPDTGLSLGPNDALIVAMAAAVAALPAQVQAHAISVLY